MHCLETHSQLQPAMGKVKKVSRSIRSLKTSTTKGKNAVRKPAFLNAQTSTKKAVGKKKITEGIKPKKRRSVKEAKTKGRLSFPIVGIGGSAGGLEAVSALLQNLAPNLGMAYVYIQHLSPTHESFLAEILQRKTAMPVHTVKDNIPVKQDNIYVIPPKHFVTITDGKLKLQEQKGGNMLHSIDRFLASLAPIYQQNAIGILLSGTGTDGSLGLMSIKAEGGVTFAQDDSAQYMAMPHHAVEMGCVDFVMPPEKIAKELASLIQQPYAVTTQNDFFRGNKTELNKIHHIMKSSRGVDFSHYKQSTIHRRILRRMALNKMVDLQDYAALLNNNKSEADALYQDLLITVTNFFREPEMFKALTEKILPVIFKNRSANDPVRIWIPGCATGEEAVSIAIAILEFLGEKVITTQVQIFATDLNEKAIEKARRGIYLKSALQNVSAQRLRKFFVKVDGKYQVVKPIRTMCIFAPHNLLRDPPFSRMDLISCQNVLIYLESPAQNRIMHAFHYALKPTGFLLLGKSETIGGATDLFEPIAKQHKIYTKRQTAVYHHLDFIIHDFPAADIQVQDNGNRIQRARGKEDLEKETDKLLLSRYVPASVLVNKDLEILRFRGTTSRYLEPTSGKASLHLLKMVREELSFDLRGVIHRAKKEGRSVRKEVVLIETNGGTREISIEVVPIKDGFKETFYLVIFKENEPIPLPTASFSPATKKPKASEATKIASLEDQLKESKATIRIITEEFESSKEELQAANEEVLSSNEELQSINEELETSREELQSTNEELTTINEELQVRNEELKEASDYSKTIIETTHESLLMLTADLRVKSANKGFYQTFQTTPEETEEHFFYELGKHHWDIADLRKQLKMVQTREIPFAGFEVTTDFANIGRKTMLLNAQKFPRKEGSDPLILLAIQDITERKHIEEELRTNEERFRLLVQNSSDIITVFDENGTIKYESDAVESVLGYKAQERIGKNVSTDTVVHPDDRKTKLALLQNSIQRPEENISGEFRMRHKNGKYKTVEGIFRNCLDDSRINGIIATYRDVTDRKILELQKDEFIGIASHELKTPVTSIKAYTQVLQDIFENAGDKKSAGMLDKMNSQVDRLTKLIVDLLDFTRIEGGKLAFKEADYDLNELVSDVVEEIQRTTKRHRIEMKLDGSIQMHGDRDRAAQVLTNLLNNAVKYSPDANKIVVTSTLEEEFVTIGVQDFGIGIGEELAEKVFDRFFRVTEPLANTFPGLGLGLYIAAEIVKAQGGKIWLKSEKGKGSTFYFSIPTNDATS
jgi:two-component system, chemotaxis family, CheB/CheR fusion protein